MKMTGQEADAEYRPEHENRTGTAFFSTLLGRHLHPTTTRSWRPQKSPPTTPPPHPSPPMPLISQFPEPRLAGHVADFRLWAGLKPCSYGSLSRHQTKRKG